MNEIQTIEALNNYDATVDSFLSVVDKEAMPVKQSVRVACLPLQDKITIDINSCEIYLVRSTTLLTYSAEYHILRAYFHASPSLMAFLLAVYAVISTIIEVISFINTIIEVITGETLAYWLDKLLPGFQDVWNDIMKQISVISATLGWGVDGLGHLMNAFNIGAETWGIMTNKPRDAVKLEKVVRTQHFINTLSSQLTGWENDPGSMIDWIVDHGNNRGFGDAQGVISKFNDKIGSINDTTTQIASNVSGITGELLAIQNNMPEVIAKNIPQVIWDSLTFADSAINNRILPALTNITDKIEELDAVLESHRKKAEELADRIAHPGDMLAEIDKLPGYARQNQLIKIDDVTSQLMKEGNEADFAAMQSDLSNFAKVAAALGNPPSPLSFMELELPGRSPGITPEPHESWFVGDY